MRSLLLTVGALLLFSVSALAQNSSSEQLVLKQDSSDFARWEFRTAPLAYIAQWIPLDISYRLSQNFSIGPAAILFNGDRDSASGIFPSGRDGYQAGLNSMYYFDSVARNTWYTSVHAYYVDYSSYPSGLLGDEMDKVEGFSGNMALGYQWRRSYFTFLVGGGLQYQNVKVNKARYNYLQAGINAIGQPANSVSLYSVMDNTSENRSDFGPFLEFKIGMEL